MTLGEYLRALKSWLLVAGLVVGLLCAAAFTHVTTPVYAATTTLFVSAQGLQNDASRAYQGNQLSTEMVKTYTELITSDRIRLQVSNRLQTAIKPGQIVATAQPQTVLITTTVTDASPIERSKSPTPWARSSSPSSRNSNNLLIIAGLHPP